MKTNPNLQLVKGILGLYLNRQLETKNAKVTYLVDQVISSIKIPTDSMGEQSEGDVARALLITVEFLKGLGPDVELSVEDVVSRIRINTGFDTAYTEVISEYLAVNADEATLQQKVRSICTELNYEINQQKIARVVALANQKLNFETEHINLQEFVMDMTEELRDATQAEESQEHVGFAGRVGSDDTSALEAVFEEATSLEVTEGILNTGIQGINDMFDGGLRRGHCVNIAAPTHHGKSLTINKIVTNIPIFNVPYMLDKEKKPIVIKISFENKLTQDIPEIYKMLWEEEHQRVLDKKTINAKEATDYIVEKLQSKGYSFALEAYDPNNFDVYDLIDIVNRYESQGYEIHLMGVDYMELITKSMAKKIRADQAINDAFEIFRNHCFPRSITQLNGHQTSTDVGKLMREGTAGLAKRISEGGYLMNSQSLSTKFDCEIYQVKHQIGDRKFLTFARGKARGMADTPEVKRSFAYEFGFGGIPSDGHLEESKAIYKWSEIENNGSAVDSGDYGDDNDGDDW